MSGLVAAAVSAVALGGCMGDRMTYGTGMTPGAQTVADVSGMVSLGGSKKPIVRYQPRPKIVAPPAGAALANANWPKDPDEQARQRALMKARAGTSLLPSDNPDVEVIGLPSTGKGDLRDQKIKPEDQAILDAQNVTKANKLRAEVKAAELGVDANGNRIRKTLTDPPVAYREPDAGAPTDFAVAKRKFRWPWQKADAVSVVKQPSPEDPSQ
ncbi:MAG: hypothetical protein J0H63_00970 [Rhizobiales bacterium]|nr:hypothetical protein [Hyphomicrobiales bacterium]